MYDLIESTADFLVVYKYPGVSFHREGEVAGLFETVKDCERLTELYPVHRLDKITSGLLVMAKTASANLALTAQFKAREVEKFYLAISAKKPRKKQGLVKGDMAPSRRSAWKLLPTTHNPAITQFFSCSLGAGQRLFLVRPRTGKTHQIRVALKSVGAPILGDELYADQSACVTIDRAYLHAYQLGFTLGEKFHRFQVLPRHGASFLNETFLKALGQYSQPERLAWPAS